MIMRINLPETLEMETPYGRATLTRSRRLCHGRNDLSDIKWYTYTITIENHAELDLAYDCIAVSFAKITEEILKEAAAHICMTGVSTAEQPNIDARTGNIHPKADKEPDREVQQLVLCNQSGPLCAHFLETDDCYCYTAVHKACYYPLINPKDKEYVGNDARYRLLEAVWEALHQQH